MQFDTIDFTVGDHFLSALINGDETGLNDEEAADLVAFIDGAELPQPGHWETTDDRDEFGRCEVTGLRGAVERVQWVFRVKE